MHRVGFLKWMMIFRIEKHRMFVYFQNKNYTKLLEIVRLLRQITKLTIIHYETDFTQISNLIILPRNSNFQFFRFL